MHLTMAYLLQLVTGKGVLGQLGLYTGLSQTAVKAAVFGLVAFNYLSATNPRYCYLHAACSYLNTIRCFVAYIACGVGRMCIDSKYDLKENLETS